jgi:hypothetical protein
MTTMTMPPRSRLILLSCIAYYFLLNCTKQLLAFSPTSSVSRATATIVDNVNGFNKRDIIISTSPNAFVSSTVLRVVSSSISTATGEADRAFRQGIQLEKAGLARAASAAFHEAATLYQCFVDHSSTIASEKLTIDGDVITTSSVDGGNTSPVNIFQHVTSLAANSDDGTTSPTVLAVLAYACIRLGHLSHDAFGDSRASKRLYKLAASIDPHPSGVSYHGIGTSVEASITHCFGRNSASSEGNIWREEMEKAVEAYKEAIKLGGGLGSNGEVLFHLAVALEVCFAFYFSSVLCIISHHVLELRPFAMNECAFRIMQH